MTKQSRSPRARRVLAISGLFILLASTGEGALIDLVNPADSLVFNPAKITANIKQNLTIPTAHAGSGGGSGGGSYTPPTNNNSAGSGGDSSRYSDSDEQENDNDDNRNRDPNCTTGASGVVNCNAADSTPPKITITNPQDGTTFQNKTTSVKVEATVADDTDPNPKVTGLGTYKLKEGSNTISVTATDASGNTWTETVTINRETKTKKPTPNPNTNWKDGTYEGTGYYVFGGNSAAVTLKVNIVDGKIATLSFITFPTSPAVKASDFDAALTKVITTQKSTIDVVTGATGTSRAVQDSLDEALAQAKGTTKPRPPITTQPPTITAKPAGGTFQSAISVVLKASDPKAKIYYTIDGSTPTKRSTLYKHPLAVSKSSTIKFIAIGDSGTSKVSVETYTVKALQSKDFKNKPIPTDWQAKDTGKDTDGDGISDLNELAIGTDPNSSDSDNDGNPDKIEILNLYSPTKSGNVLLFSDLMPNHWARQFIAKLYLDDVVKGYSDGSYRPEKRVNRAEGIKMVIEAVGIPLEINEIHRFTDISANDWFYPYVQTAVKNGIINRTDRFNPGADLTRAETIKLVVESLGGSNLAGDFAKYPSFSDVDQLDWFSAYAEFAKLNNIIGGYSNGTFGGGNPVTRAQLAKIVFQARSLQGSTNLAYAPTLTTSEVAKLKSKRAAAEQAAAAARAAARSRAVAKARTRQQSAANAAAIQAAANATVRRQAEAAAARQAAQVAASAAAAAAARAAATPTVNTTTTAS